ncbi:Hypothetical protein A7982_07613 [Minicystis rosea]|nr:Hypothetical protein A7982_07613 [Minicystis rosea]
MTVTVNLTHILRPTMASIAREIRDLLLARKQAGPAEPALDDYIPQLDAVAGELDTHVESNAKASAARATRVATLDVADDEVDRWYRHVHGYLEAESFRRTGTSGALALALLEKAFPDGLEHVDGRIEDENVYLRKSLAVLKDAEQAAHLAAIDFPVSFVERLDKALAASNAALADVVQARDDKSSAVSAGRDAEDEWIDLVVRLRKYVGSRGSRKSDPARYDEGLALLAPLLKELKRLRADATTRATKARAKAEAEAKAKAGTG